MTLYIYDAAGNKVPATSEQQAAARTDLGAASAADLAATSATATAAQAAATSAAAAAASAQATATSAGTAAASAQTAATAAQAAAAAAYVKPASGIPHSDLHQGIRDQLDLAETALQPGKLPAGTTIPLSQVTGAGTAAATDASDYAAASHVHTVANVAGLQATLDGKMPNTLAAMSAAFVAGSAAEEDVFQSLVSGYVATFQDLLNITLPSPGRRACVVRPVFSGGIPYTRWIYDGTAWRLDGPQDLLIDSSPSVGAASTAEQILKQTTADAGLLLALRYFIIRTVVAKSGATDAVSSSRIRFGANGTTSDTPISNDTAFSAPNRQRAIEVPLFATSTTMLRHYTNGGGGGMAWTLTTQAYPTQVPVENMLSATKFSFCAQMAGTTDTPTMVSVFIYGG